MSGCRSNLAIQARHIAQHGNTVVDFFVKPACRLGKEPDARIVPLRKRDSGAPSFLFDLFDVLVALPQRGVRDGRRPAFIFGSRNVEAVRVREAVEPVRDVVRPAFGSLKLGDSRAGAVQGASSVGGNASRNLELNGATVLR